MKKVVLIVLYSLFTVVLTGCYFGFIPGGEIVLEDNPTAVTLDKKELPDEVLDYHEIPDDKIIFLARNKEMEEWSIREYSLNKDYKLLDKFSFKTEDERYIRSFLMDNHLIMITYVYDDDEEIFNVFARKINVESGKIISEKKLLKYPWEKDVMIDDDLEEFVSYKPTITLSPNHKYFAIKYTSYCEDTEQYIITGSVMDKDIKEQYNFSQVLREEEKHRGSYLSNLGEFMSITFLDDEDNEKKYISLHRQSGKQTFDLDHELPYELLDEDEYRVHDSKIAEDQAGNITMVSILREDYLMGIFLGRYNKEQNKFDNTNLYKITEEIAEKLNDDDDISGNTSIEHMSVFEDNKIFLMLIGQMRVYDENTGMAWESKGPGYFFTFDKNLNLSGQNSLIDLKMHIHSDNFVNDEINGENSIMLNKNSIDLFTTLGEPEFGFYKCIYDFDKNEFQEPKFLFSYSGLFGVFRNKFMKTKNGILFVTNETIGTVTSVATPGIYYTQNLYHFDFK